MSSARGCGHDGVESETSSSAGKALVLHLGVSVSISIADYVDVIRGTNSKKLNEFLSRLIRPLSDRWDSRLTELLGKSTNSPGISIDRTEYNDWVLHSNA